MVPSLLSAPTLSPLYSLQPPLFGWAVYVSSAVHLVAASFSGVLWLGSPALVRPFVTGAAGLVAAVSTRTAAPREQQVFPCRTPEARSPLSAESFVFVSENRGSCSGLSFFLCEGQRTTYALFSSLSPRLFITGEAARSAPNLLPLNQKVLTPNPDRGTRKRDVAFLLGLSPYGSFPRAERAQAWRGQGHKD